MVQVLNDATKFITINHAPTDASTFSTDHFAGGGVDYIYQTIDHKLFPTKGFHFNTRVDYLHNLQDANKYVAHFGGVFGFYVPIAKDFTLAIKTGAATLTGQPEFYQLNKLGGGSTLRGFLRYRFYGKTAVYNQNELQYNFNVKTYLFSGKMGILALLDDGRVWQPGETSTKWHVGTGGGLMLAPFNKISLTTTYTLSNEGGRFNVRAGKLF